MTARHGPDRNKSDKVQPPPRATRFTYFPWKRLAWASVPVGLLAYYMTMVAPRLIPVPPDVRVPFPALTTSLEELCTWCGDHRLAVLLVGAGLLLAGALFRLTAARYYVILTVVATFTLTMTFLSVSAPIDRLLKKVEASLPKDSRVPSHRPAEDAEDAEHHSIEPQE